MSTSVCRYTPPLLPGVVSWYATPSPPLSKFSASIFPGMAAGEPEKGDSPGDGDGVEGALGDVGVGTLADAMVIAPRLKPALSTSRVSTCRPAVSETGSVTVVHVCQAPVAGI